MPANNESNDKAVVTEKTTVKKLTIDDLQLKSTPAKRDVSDVAGRPVRHIRRGD